jgi:hypothetical protein
MRERLVPTDDPAQGGVHSEGSGISIVLDGRDVRNLNSVTSIKVAGPLTKSGALIHGGAGLTSGFSNLQGRSCFDASTILRIGWRSQHVLALENASPNLAVWLCYSGGISPLVLDEPAGSGT